MRRLMFAAVLALAGSFAGGAQALPGAVNPGLASDSNSLVENVRLVCRPVWNGWAWVRQCYHTGPRYYAPPRFYHHHHHHRPHRWHHHHHRHHHRW
ncbi:hypothetical protein [Afipia sp. P52-10]|uniref:hypothetical protein n=1 Tax=Afipia sp. P52-10 TaxID=1429916 RepID=UPI0009DF0695|nr:hypothetical protein [Afipia sp. P52-10]